MFQFVKLFSKLASAYDEKDRHDIADALDALSFRIAQTGWETNKSLGWGTQHISTGDSVGFQAQNQDVKKVLNEFMYKGQPVFIRGKDGTPVLILHGTKASGGNMFFKVGTGNPVAPNQDFIDQKQLKDYIAKQGYPASTQIAACYGGNISKLDLGGGSFKPAFDNSGVLEISVPQTGEGDEIIFKTK
jgi:hypothetical protein